MISGLGVHDEQLAVVLLGVRVGLEPVGPLAAAVGLPPACRCRAFLTRRAVSALDLLAVAAMIRAIDPSSSVPPLVSVRLPDLDRAGGAGHAPPRR